MNEWQRPKTTRRYVHPPMCERVVNLWSEGKITVGEVEMNPGPAVPDYHQTVIGCGIWPVYGEEMTAADFKTSEPIMYEDGIPVHALRNRFGAVDMRIEAVCDTERKTTCFLKVDIENPTDTVVCETIGFYVRTGLESVLIFDAPDVYRSYAPDVQVWKEAKCTWSADGSIYRDGDYFITTSGDVDLSFDEERGLAYADVSLKAGKTKTLYFTLGKGEIVTRDYDEQVKDTVAFYKKELGRINNLPVALSADDEKVSLIRNLTIQMLQCFARPVGEDFVLCRQGGLQRRMWPFEALYALEALNRLGDFDDYVEPAVSVYFDVMQAEDGEVIPLGLPWAMASACALYSFADYAMMRGGREYYEKYRDAAMRAYECIKRTRASTLPTQGVVVGLYPPRQSCDCEFVFQSWTFTDTMNLIGIRKFLDAAVCFADPMVEDIKQECEDYCSAIQSCLDRAKELAGESDEMAISSFVPGFVGDEKLFAFPPFIGVMMEALEVEHDDVIRIMNHMQRRERIKNGLYWRMPTHYYRHDPDGVVREWYPTLDDCYWFNTFARLGMYDRCDEIIDATINYSMTDEGYMQERYHERNPYFTPWSPNASGNGRMISMLLKQSAFDREE